MDEKTRTQQQPAEAGQRQANQQADTGRQQGGQQPNQNQGQFGGGGSSSQQHRQENPEQTDKRTADQDQRAGQKP